MDTGNKKKSGKVNIEAVRQVLDTVLNEDKAIHSDVGEGPSPGTWRKITQLIGVETLGEYVRLVRQKKQFNLKEVASELQLSSSVVREIENNRMLFFRLTIDQAVDLTRLLELNRDVVVNFLNGLELGELPDETSFYRRSDKSKKAGSDNKTVKDHNREEQIRDFIQQYIRLTSESKSKGSD